jgi:hypothetical protein
LVFGQQFLYTGEKYGLLTGAGTYELMNFREGIRLTIHEESVAA